MTESCHFETCFAFSSKLLGLKIKYYDIKLFSVNNNHGVEYQLKI